MVKVCKLTDLAEIESFVSEWEGDIIVTIRKFLVHPDCYVLSSRDKSIYFFLEAKCKRSAIMHIYCAKESRGMKMFRFIKEVKEWGLENTDFQFVFNYTNDHRVKFIMKYLGSKRIGEYRGQTVYKQVVRRGN